jgi:hypothetical protein
MRRDAPVHANRCSLKPRSTRVVTGMVKIISSLIIIIFNARSPLVVVGRNISSTIIIGVRFQKEMRLSPWKCQNLVRLGIRT